MGYAAIFLCCCGMGLFDFLKNSTEQSLKECKANPRKCFAQLLLDGLVIIASYGSLVYLVDGKMVDPLKALKFYGLFLVIAYVFRYLDVDFQEQLTRVAGFQVGTKLFMAMAS